MKAGYKVTIEFEAFERRGTSIYTEASIEKPGTAKFIAEAKTAEDADAIVALLNADFDCKTNLYNALNDIVLKAGAAIALEHNRCS